MEKQFYCKFPKGNTTENWNKSISREDLLSNLPTMNSYNNTLTNFNKCNTKRASSNIFKFNISPLSEDNKQYAHTSRNPTNKQKMNKIVKTNKLINYYSHINIKDNLETRNEKVMNIINSIGQDNHKGYFTGKRATGNKKEMALIKVGKDKIYIFKEKIKHDLKMSADANKFLDHLNNPSMGIGFLKKKYPILYDKYHGIYETNIEKNFCKKNLKEILIAMKTSNATNETDFRTVNNNNLAKVKKLKLKWKTIKWFLEHKKNNLERLFQKQDIISANFKGGKGLNIKQFSKVLKENGIINDNELINKLFWVFDEDGSGDIEYKELAFGLEMFRDSSYENKIKVFFDICDSDNSGAISKQEFYSMLRKNLVNSKLRLIIRQVVDKIFHSSFVNSNGEITYENLKASCAQNKILNELIIDNLEALKKIDDVIDNDFKTEFDHIDPNKNEEIRRRLNNVKEIIIPGRDNKFEKMLNDFINLKEEQVSSRKLYLNNDDYYTF